MRNKKKTFVLHEDHKMAIDRVYELFGGDDLKIFVDAIWEFGIERRHTPFENKNLELAFDKIKVDIARANEAYDKTIEQRREAGKIGAQKRWSKNTSMEEQEAEKQNTVVGYASEYEDLLPF